MAIDGLRRRALLGAAPFWAGLWLWVSLAALALGRGRWAWGLMLLLLPWPLRARGMLRVFAICHWLHGLLMLCCWRVSRGGG